VEGRPPPPPPAVQVCSPAREAARGRGYALAPAQEVGAGWVGPVETATPRSPDHSRGYHRTGTGHAERRSADGPEGTDARQRRIDPYSARARRADAFGAAG